MTKEPYLNLGCPKQLPLEMDCNPKQLHIEERADEPMIGPDESYEVGRQVVVQQSGVEGSLASG